MMVMTTGAEKYIKRRNDKKENAERLTKKRKKKEGDSRDGNTDMIDAVSQIGRRKMTRR